ncbi:flavin reductase family protein [Candidatus Bathyarchaeota archaeon]|nr:flavin reductase family protein [Candidatus Bathyarchaeota archaeon]
MMGKGKTKVAAQSAYRLLHPMHTVLVSCIGKVGKPNIITLAWAMPTSINPPLVAVSIAPRRHSYNLIKETGEFVVNIPTMGILKETLVCGRVSGRDHDKFEETGFTALPAKKVRPPAIGECVAHLECKLHSEFITGDHTVFVGEIVEAYANEGVFTEEYDLEKAKMIFHLGANDFATLEPKIHKLAL